MRHTFDLTDIGIARFGCFPEAIAALTIPTECPKTLSVLVWGVIIREPEQDAAFCQLLHPDVRASLPNQLYLAGWGVLTFTNICRGEVTVSPYRPVLLSTNHEFFTDPASKPVTLAHAWPGLAGSDSREYLLSIILEKPFGFMSLKVTTPGPVQLLVDPADIVTEDQFLADPARYDPDFQRLEKWREVNDLLGAVQQLLRTRSRSLAAFSSAQLIAPVRIPQEGDAAHVLFLLWAILAAAE